MDAGNGQYEFVAGPVGVKLPADAPVVAGLAALLGWWSAAATYGPYFSMQASLERTAHASLFAVVVGGSTWAIRLFLNVRRERRVQSIQAAARTFYIMADSLFGVLEEKCLPQLEKAIAAGNPQACREWAKNVAQFLGRVKEEFVEAQVKFEKMGLLRKKDTPFPPEVAKVALNTPDEE